MGSFFINDIIAANGALTKYPQLRPLALGESNRAVGTRVASVPANPGAVQMTQKEADRELLSLLAVANSTPAVAGEPVMNFEIPGRLDVQHARALRSRLRVILSELFPTKEGLKIVPAWPLRRSLRGRVMVVMIDFWNGISYRMAIPSKSLDSLKSPAMFQSSI